MPPKHIINSNVEDEASLTTVESKTVTKLADNILFEPTATQSKIKAKFWSRYHPGPFDSPSDGKITLATALEVTGSTSLRKYWSQPGFREWFLNRDEEREKLKYLFNKALDSAEKILDNPEANPNAKANIIKMLAEMNGFMGKKQIEKFADDDINKMSEKQLKEFLTKKGVKVVQENIIDASTTTADTKKEDSDS